MNLSTNLALFINQIIFAELLREVFPREMSIERILPARTRSCNLPAAHWTCFGDLEKESRNFNQRKVLTLEVFLKLTFSISLRGVMPGGIWGTGAVESDFEEHFFSCMKNFSKSWLGNCLKHLLHSSWAWLIGSGSNFFSGFSSGGFGEDFGTIWMQRFLAMLSRPRDSNNLTNRNFSCSCEA